MLAPASVTNIKIRYDAKTPQFAIFGTCVISVYTYDMCHMCTLPKGYTYLLVFHFESMIMGKHISK